MNSRTNSLVRTCPVLTFFVLTYAITCTSALLTRLMVEGILPPNRIVPAIAYCSPSIAGVILMVSLYGRSGCRYLASRLNPARMGFRWPIVCVILPPVLLLVAVALYLAGTTGNGAESGGPLWFTWPNLILGIGWHTFLGAGVREELGWRAFALPHLQRKRTALTSALLIGLVWAAWHFPAGLIMGTSSINWMEATVYTVAATAMSVVFVAVFNATNGSIVAVMLLHGANNASWSYLHDVLPDLDMGDAAENMLVGALWVIVAIICVVIWGPEHLSREQRQVIDFDADRAAAPAPSEESADSQSA